MIATSTETVRASTESRQATAWNAVASMTLCVALLIAAEFMPVSLLTPIAQDLHATPGMAGQAVSISGLFAIATSLYIATFASRYDRRYVLVSLTAIMTLSLAVIALSPNFFVLMTESARLAALLKNGTRRTFRLSSFGQRFLDFIEDNAAKSVPR
jgi:predicted MFS family arabinose efflux permease